MSSSTAGSQQDSGKAGQQPAHSSPLGQKTSGQASGEAPIEFVLVGPDDLTECPFWVSFYSPGTIKPMAALSYRGSIADSLTAFGRQGIDYDDTFVTINAEVDPPQHLYMFPLARLKKQLTDPVDTLLANIGSFKPEKVGLYLTDSEETSLTVYDLYHDMVAEILTNPHVKSVYFHSPDHGYHAVLNLISRVKHSLEAKHGPIFIIH